MKTLTAETLSYIAGIFDGEGYVGIIRHQSENDFWPCFMPRFVVAMTDKESIDWLKQETGIGAVSRVEAKGNRKDSYHWRLRICEMREFVPLLVPYLKLKRRRAELLLEFLKTCKGRRGGWVRLSESEYELRESIYEELSKLNHRGRPYDLSRL